MENPIDKEKTAEHPGLIKYPHHIGSFVIKPEDAGKIKSRAINAMREQTSLQLGQIQSQVELLLDQANALQKRIEVSQNIYSANIPFEPIIGKTYHLYKKDDVYRLMLIAPYEWGRSIPLGLEFVNTVLLLSDHTWQIL